MKKLLLSVLLSFVLIIGLGSFHVFSQSINSSSLGFIENKGQIIDQDYHPNPKVKFLLCRSGFNVQLRQTGFSYDTYTDSVGEQSAIKSAHSKNTKSTDQQIVQRRYHRVDVELLNCNADAQLVAYDTSLSYFNYFTAGTPEGGAKNVHSYQKIIYKNIYANIDLEFKVNNKQSGGAEYDFIVHPGANISDIQLLYSGANKTFLENNLLKVQVAAGTFTENIPSSYLIDNGQLQRTVDVQYRSSGNNVYSFHLASSILDPQSTIIIDPTPCLTWGTYYGGQGMTINGISAGETSSAITADGNGNVYVTGFTASNTNIATAGAYQDTIGGTNVNMGFIPTDIFIAKFNPALPAANQLVWGTYYGGNDSTVAFGYGWGIALDANNNVYIAAEASGNGMATAGAYQTTQSTPCCHENALIAKFNSAGDSLLWATYYGNKSYPQSNANGANAIAVDASNNVYVTGWAEDPTEMATSNAYRTSIPYGNGATFVAKFNPSLAGHAQLVWGTYFGGQQTNNDNGPYGIAIDANNNVYVTGATGDATGIATPGAFRTIYPAGAFTAVYVAKFNPSLSGAAQLVWGTYYGGYSLSGGIALDSDKNVYVTAGLFGGSDSTIVTAGAYQNVNSGIGSPIVIGKFNPTGSSLLWGTYYGGTGINESHGIALDPCRNVTITGWTSSTSGIATPNAYQTSYGGGQYDAFVAKIDTDGKSLLWGTYYGGSGIDQSNGVALSGDNVFLTGTTYSKDSISTAGAWQSVYADTATAQLGGSNAFVSEFGCNAGCAACHITTANISSPTNSICPGDSVRLTANATPSGIAYLWNTGSTTQSITVDTTGDYSCTIYSCDDSAQVSPVHIALVPVPPAPDITLRHDTLFCKSDPSYSSYQWSFDSASIASGTDTFLVISKNGEYNMQVTNENGCTIVTGINVTSVGIQNYVSDNIISLSPNPVTNQLTVHTSSFHNETVIVSIMNVLGQETSPPTPLFVERGVASIDVSGLPAGMYFLQLKSAGGSFAQKFVKE